MDSVSFVVARPAASLCFSFNAKLTKCVLALSTQT